METSPCPPTGSVALGGGPPAAPGRHGSQGTGVAQASSIAGRGWRVALTRGGRTGEGALVRAAQRGSEEAVEALFARHWGAAYRTAFLVSGDRAAAEDIAQEAFLAALRALPTFDARRPLGPVAPPDRREPGDRLVARAGPARRGRRRRRAGAARARTPPGGPRSGTRSCEALAQLGPEQRAVIVLRYLLELTPGEIARALDLPRGTVNSRLRRGLDALGDLMGGDPR